MKKILILTVMTLSFLSVAVSAMEIPRGAYKFVDLEKAKAEAIKKQKAICFFVT